MRFFLARWQIKDTQQNPVAIIEQTQWIPAIYSVKDATNSNIVYATITRGVLSWTDSWLVEVKQKLPKLDERSYFFMIADISFTGVH
jgi:hypothetical protein